MESLGYILCCTGLKDKGVHSYLQEKTIYFKEGEFGPETTKNIFEAKRFTNIEDIKNIKFRNTLMSSGEVHRESFLYNCFGQSKEKNKLYIKELFVSEPIETISEEVMTIKHDCEIDPEYEMYLTLSKKFNK